VEQLATRGVDDRDVTLVGRLVADVAPVVAITCPFAKFIAAAIFSRAGNRVIRVCQSTWPSATRSFWTMPSGDAA